MLRNEFRKHQDVPIENFEGAYLRKALDVVIQFITVKPKGWVKGHEILWELIFCDGQENAGLHLIR